MATRIASVILEAVTELLCVEWGRLSGPDDMADYTQYFILQLFPCLKDFWSSLSSVQQQGSLMNYP